jgi:hypothetical protein
VTEVNRERTVEAGTVDGFAAGAVMVGEVASLKHELAMEGLDATDARVCNGRTLGMTRWNPLPAKPKPCWPVASSRKLRAVLGTVSS